MQDLLRTLIEQVSEINRKQDNLEGRLTEFENQAIMATPRRVGPEDREPVPPPRRSTMFHDYGQDAPPASPIQAVPQVATQPMLPQVLLSPQPIPADFMVTSLTIRSWLWMKELFRKFFASTQDPTKSYIHFFSPQVQKLMVDNEKRLKTPYSETLTYDSILSVKNATLMSIVSRYLRPITRDDYNELFISQVGTLRAKDSKWGFDIVDYDVQLHAPVNKLLEELEAVYTLIEFQVPKAESDLWPKPRWGSKDCEELLQLFYAKLGNYKENFQAIITYEKLKAMTSAQEFFKAVEEANDLYCNKARELKREQAKLRPPAKHSVLIKQAEEDAGRWQQARTSMELAVSAYLRRRIVREHS